MKVLVSGATGLVGRYIVEGLLAAGYPVIAGGRHRPREDFFSAPVGFVPLELDADRDQIDAFDDAYFFIHCAFDHLPGRYRGGEGDDPQTFRRKNLEGSVALFDAARRAGTRRIVFLSSRAVYDGLPEGIVLTEDLDLAPTSLYGEIKLQAERALSMIGLTENGLATASLRLTGVYGGLRPNKWDGLIADAKSGQSSGPARAGTEVHGHDVAAAVRLMLESDIASINGRAFNVSDVLTDTNHILQRLRMGSADRPDAATGHSNDRSIDAAPVNIMATDRIRALGWQPGGQPLLDETLAALAGADTRHGGRAGRDDSNSGVGTVDGISGRDSKSGSNAAV
jgi:UDP-glucose 4-epimerase